MATDWKSPKDLIDKGKDALQRREQERKEKSKKRAEGFLKSLIGKK